MSSTPTLITSETETFMGILSIERTMPMSGGATSFLVLRPFGDGDETSIEDMFKPYQDTIVQIEIKKFELVAPDTRGGREYDKKYMEDGIGK